MTGLGSSCGACKFLRRRCASDCIFAPYFCHEEASTHFAAVHKVFGASNVSKLLLHLPVDSRADAAITISCEALARMRDPVYGCFAYVFALQQQVANLQEEIEFLESYIVSHMIGFDNNGVSQQAADTCTNDQSYYSPPPPANDAMDTIYYQNQQDSSVLLNNPGNPTNVSQANLASSQMNSQVSNSLQGWQYHHSSIFESSLNHIVAILEADQERDIQEYYRWMDIV